MEFLALAELDRSVLERCLRRKPRAWEDFVDRFMGLVLHVIDHTTQVRGIRPSEASRDHACAAVFTALARDDFELLRRYRGHCSLATYLTVVARRIAVRFVLDRLERGPDCPEVGPAAASAPVERGHRLAQEAAPRSVEAASDRAEPDGSSREAIWREIHAPHGVAPSPLFRQMPGTGQGPS